MYPDKVAFCRQRGFYVEEKRGWVRIIRSQAKERLNEKEYKDCMRLVGWESII